VKPSTIVIAIRAWSKFSIPFFSTWVASLAQWIGTDNPTGPPSFVWWCVVVPASLAAGFSGLDGFFSGAWQSYIKNGTATPPIEIVEIVPPPAK